MTARPSAPPLAALLDLDGVLVDSAAVHQAAWTALFAAQGIDFGPARYRAEACGHSRADVIRSVLGARPDHESLMRRKADLVYAILDRDGCPAIPGARALLEALHARGLPLSVATASRMPGPFLTAAGLADLVPVVVDRNDVPHGKPAPDVYLRAAALLDVPAPRCFAVEDSPTGVTAARAAGAFTVAVTTNHPAEDLTAADAIVEGLDEVLGVVFG